MKVEIRDINKYLSVKAKIAVTGKYSLSIMADLLKRFRNNCKNIHNKINESIANVRKNISDGIKNSILSTEEAKQEQINKQIEKIDEKKENLERIIDEMEQDEEYTSGIKNCYLKEAKNELEKLDKKRMKVSSKGLGVFSLPKILLANVKKNERKGCHNTITNKKFNNMEEVKAKLKQNMEEFLKLREQEKQIREKYPDLDTSKIRKVVAIKKPDTELGNRIKNSNNFKKALAAIAFVTGITVGSNMYSCTNKNIEKADPINIPDNHIEQVKESNDVVAPIPENEIKSETNIKLGDYLTIENGSTIYGTPELNGKHGTIGTNGYDNATLFKINAITYVDENNVETTFNVVQKNDQAKKIVEERHNKYIENNPNVKVKNFHVTPCDELGIPVNYNANSVDLGGWTNADNAKIQNVDAGQVLENSYELLGGKVR